MLQNCLTPETQLKKKHGSFDHLIHEEKDHPDQTFAILKHNNPSTDILPLHKIRQTPDSKF